MGKLWLLVDSMYTDSSSIVKWNGNISTSFKEAQGIRQGGVSSTVLFNNRSTTLLEKLSRCPDSLRIGSLPVGAVMCADDLALLTDSTIAMQNHINEAASDASRERLSFSDTKTKIMTLDSKGKKTCQTPSILLYDSVIGSTTCEKHLGIQRSSDGKNRPTIEARITLARQTAYGLMGAGLHGLNGVSPSVCVKILNIYVCPRLIFGLDSLVLSTEDMKLLEKTYRKYLRCCQHLPDNTAIPAIYLLSGALPIE